MEKDLLIEKVKYLNLIRKCILSDNYSERSKYGHILMDRINEAYINGEKTKQIFDDLIEKLTKAASFIQEQNEWFDCLYIAMGDKQNEIISKALIAHEAVEKYKTKHAKNIKND